METLRKLSSILVLTVMFGLPALAGETQTPPCAPPVPGETQTPPCPAAPRDTSDATSSSTATAATAGLVLTEITTEVLREFLLTLW